MQVDHYSETFRVGFKRGVLSEGKIVYEDPSENNKRRVTVCTITQKSGTDWKVVGEDTTTCSKSDQFCKEQGRKISLKRALAATMGWGKLTPSELGDEKKHRLFRTAIWKAYINRK